MHKYVLGREMPDWSEWRWRDGELVVGEEKSFLQRNRGQEVLDCCFSGLF